MSIEKINNRELVLNKLGLSYLKSYKGFNENVNEDKVIREAMDEVVEKLLTIGGIKNITNQNITFTFGNGEAY